MYWGIHSIGGMRCAATTISSVRSIAAMRLAWLVRTGGTDAIRTVITAVASREPPLGQVEFIGPAYRTDQAQPLQSLQVEPCVTVKLLVGSVLVRRARAVVRRQDKAPPRPLRLTAVVADKYCGSS